MKFDFLLYLIPVTIFSSTMLISFVYAILEKEETAATRSIMGMTLLCLPYFLLYFMDIPHKLEIVIGLNTVFLLIGLILFFPDFRKNKRIIENPTNQYDERDVIFKRRSMNEIQKEAYYKMRPENKTKDDEWRNKPGLLSSKSTLYNSLQFKATDANFIACEHLIELAKNMTPAEKKEDLSPKRLTEFLKKYLDNSGAYDCGITELQAYHIYSHSGQGDTHGKEINLPHKYAIAIVVEMDKVMMDYAPAGPTVMETSNQYYQAGGIAVRAAQFLNLLGYDSKAHIDSYYDVICPLVARDAGLGEIGRMGLLMHPKLGPRLRLAVITTDAPLITDIRKPDYSSIAFCEVCKKCADVCPSKAVPFDSQKPDSNGITRWQIDMVKCFDLWCSMGTDCGRCVKSCPYSHPNNIFHNAIRMAIKYFPVFRRFAFYMDDFFYGRVPTQREVEDYLK
jgi:reductive dehalogenase